MHAPEAPEQGDTIGVTLGRFGQNPMDLRVPTGSTVREALNLAGVNGDGNVFVGGNPARDENILDEGDIINVVTSKQGG